MPKRPHLDPPAPPEPRLRLYAPETGGRDADRQQPPAVIPPIPPGMHAPETGLIRKLPKK